MLKKISEIDIYFLLSGALTFALMFLGGLHARESLEIGEFVTSLSVTMAGFGLIAFQIARSSNTLRNDFLESSILMILCTATGVLYLVYPSYVIAGFNLGELNLIFFFWSLILTVLILIDKRFDLIP